MLVQVRAMVQWLLKLGQVRAIVQWLLKLVQVRARQVSAS
jgi:tRNA U38,U39,U40 pseudouridine synthase TruA